MVSVRIILRLMAIAASVAIVILTVVPAPQRPVTMAPHDLEHFAAFCLTGILYGVAFERRLSQLLLAAVTYAILLECIQIPLPTRHARLEDAVVDAAALCIGLVLGKLSQGVIQRLLRLA